MEINLLARLNWWAWAPRRGIAKSNLQGNRPQARSFRQNRPLSPNRSANCIMRLAIVHGRLLLSHRKRPFFTCLWMSQKCPKTTLQACAARSPLNAAFASLTKEVKQEQRWWNNYMMFTYPPKVRKWIRARGASGGLRSARYVLGLSTAYRQVRKRAGPIAVPQFGSGQRAKDSPRRLAHL